MGRYRITAAQAKEIRRVEKKYGQGSPEALKAVLMMLRPSSIPGLDMKHLLLKAAQINAPNDAVNQTKVNELSKVMRRNGWTGRPLLIRPDGDGYQALTGAHRLMAASALGIEVPVLLIEDEDMEDGPELSEEPDAEDIINFLVSLHLNEAAEILEQEPCLNSRYSAFLRHWF